MVEVCVHGVMTSPPELHLIFLVSWKLLWEPCRTKQNQRGIRHILSRGEGSSAPEELRSCLCGTLVENKQDCDLVSTSWKTCHIQVRRHGGLVLWQICVNTPFGRYPGQMSHQSSVLLFIETGEPVFSGPVGLINSPPPLPPHTHPHTLFSLPPLSANDHRFHLVLLGIDTFDHYWYSNGLPPPGQAITPIKFPFKAKIREQQRTKNIQVRIPLKFQLNNFCHL